MNRGYELFVNSVAEFLKLLADNAERLSNNYKKFCNFLSENCGKGFNNNYGKNAERSRRN